MNHTDSILSIKNEPFEKNTGSKSKCGDHADKILTGGINVQMNPKRSGYGFR
ncbi:hypothetical protein SAMN05444412_110151 [Rhodonellum ikkaensis]|nr:hypothetical protein SAMN05444412_110151 [Rhodonellum ikkaensis]